MRILFITDRYPPHDNSGYAQLAATTAADLQQRGHTVQVLTTRPLHQSARVENGVYYLLEPDVAEASRVPMPVQYFLQRPGREQHNVRHLQQRLADFNPDITLMWNLSRLPRRLAWMVEQTVDTQAVYYVGDASPVQPDAYSRYWQAMLHKHEKVPLRKYVSRLAMRQIRLENPGILRLDFVMCASDHIRRTFEAKGWLPLEAIVVPHESLRDQVADAQSASQEGCVTGQALDEIETALNQARTQRRLGPPLPPARSQPLFDLKRGWSRPVKISAAWRARLDDNEHLALAVQWLNVAQDKAGNGGLAQLYHAVERDWTPAYPETTGYAIPTLLHYAQLTRNEPLRERVRRMAQFLLSVQLANGAVPIVNNEMFQVVQPCAFDVGQVIYGYLAAYREFKHPDYLEAARRAGDWLIRDQEPDGSWVRFTYHNVAHAWEVRVSWALLLLAQVSDEKHYEDAARKNIAWTRSQQHADGWFDHLALVPGEAAVMHTIAYTLEGMLECGLHLNDVGIIQAARQPANLLLEQQRADGALPGAFTAGWRSVDHFTCLTGNAQMAIVWQRLYQLTGNGQYLEASERIINHICRSQLARAHDRNLLGSLPGSDPLDGDYLPNSLPNWAVKFFMDALLLRQAIRGAGRSATPPPR